MSFIKAKDLDKIKRKLEFTYKFKKYLKML